MKGNKGIGLIEFIISINIILIVVIGAYYALNLGIKTYRRIENENYINQNIRKADALISRDLRCAFLKAKDNVFKGEKDRLEFITYLPLQSVLLENSKKESGLAKIKYFVSEDKGLFREENEKTRLVAPLVKLIEFKYYDGMNWYDVWEFKYKRKLPVAVEIKFKVENEDFKDIVKIQAEQ